MVELVGRRSRGHGPRVLVAGVDATQQVAAALPVIEGAELVGQAPTATGAVGLASLYQPDLVVIDLLMDDMTAVEAIPSLHRRAPGTAVVVVGPPELRSALRLALRVGADGVIATDALPSEAVAQLQAILDRRGHSVVS